MKANKFATLILVATMAMSAFVAKADVVAPTAIELRYMIECVYDPAMEPADYYLVLSDNKDARYDGNTGTLVCNSGWVLFLDLYNEQTDPAQVPAGIYQPGEGYENFEYWPDFSYLRHYDADGNMDYEAALSGSVIVTNVSGSLYTINAVTSESEITFSGSLALNDITQGSATYTQIRQDLDLVCQGDGIAYYHGNLFDSNTGNIYLDMYTGAFDVETGGMTEEGYSVCMCAFNKLFGDPKAATPIAGTYTMARNFARETYYPGMEIDYMGITVQMGSYVKHKSSKYQDGYGYAYLDEGTMVITENEDGTFSITVDCITDLGFHVTSTFRGNFTVYDLSDDHDKTAISTLEDDVELDLDQLPVSHIWNGGFINGCQSFILDIGSPSGRDPELDEGGDCLRIEFLTEDGTQYLPEGTYSVISDRYPASYHAFGLEQGHFSSSANGDLIGTRYFWFIPGRYYVAYHFVPCVEGTVSVTKAEGTHEYSYKGGEPKTLEKYNFEIHLVDDAGFHLDGSWEGGMELMYNPDGIASVDTVGADNMEAKAVRASANSFKLINVTPNTVVSVVDPSGAVRLSQKGGETLDITDLANGIYILKVGHKVEKFVK